MRPQESHAGEWFLRSGIQESNGGVARYYRMDLERNHPLSTEITGYAVSAFVYLHSLSQDERYLERAIAGARYLTHCGWDAAARTMPFELNPSAFTYFFDCGIIVRGLLAVWRATGKEGLLDVAVSIGKAMARDFPAPDGADWHPILALPGKRPLERDALRWSQSPGCYQLKSAMAWSDLAEATGEEEFREHYEHVLEYALRTADRFLPGHPDRHKVMDRLHPYLYYLEGLLPRAGEARCAAAIDRGIHTAAEYLRDIAPEFERSDVYAQLLRVRIYAAGAGVSPLDTDAAQFEAGKLAEFQAADADPRIDGGYRFGRQGAQWLPYMNPVSTAFALQAMALWDGARNSGTPAPLHQLI